MGKSFFTDDMKSVFEGIKSVDQNSLPDGVFKLNLNVKNYNNKVI